MSEVLLKERMETIAVRKKERALKRQVPGSADQHCLVRPGRDEELREGRPLRQARRASPVKRRNGESVQEQGSSRRASSKRCRAGEDSGLFLS